MGHRGALRRSSGGLSLAAVAAGSLRAGSLRRTMARGPTRTATIRRALLGAVALSSRSPPAPAQRSAYEVPWTVDAALAPSSRPRTPRRRAPTTSAASRPAPIPSRSSSSTACSPTRPSTGGRSRRSLPTAASASSRSPTGPRTTSRRRFYQPGGLRTMQSSARELKAFVEQRPAQDRRREGRHRRPLRGQPDAELVRPLPRRRPVVDDYVGHDDPLGGDEPGRAGDAQPDRRGVRPLPRAAGERSTALCSSCRQFLAGLAILPAACTPAASSRRRVTYTSIVTRNDELVVPYTSGLLAPAPNVTNVVLQDYCAARPGRAPLGLRRPGHRRLHLAGARSAQARPRAPLRAGAAVRRRARLRGRLAPRRPQLGVLGGVAERLQTSLRLASGSTAGPLSTRPSTSKRDAWQGQSQLCSAAFHRTWQPRCVHRLDTACSLPSWSR